MLNTRSDSLGISLEVQRAGKVIRHPRRTGVPFSRGLCRICGANWFENPGRVGSQTCHNPGFAQQQVNMTRVRLTVIGLLLAAAAVLVCFQQRGRTALRSENDLLRRQFAQLSSENESLSNRLAWMRAAAALLPVAPPVQTLGAAAPAKESSATNFIAWLVKGGEVPKLTAAQLKRYLDENRRSPASLLAAYRTSGDAALLREAMGQYPADPKVAFEALMSKELPSDERRQWLETLKKAAPENPMANYLSALDFFKAGQTDQAVQELSAAAGRRGLSDYTVERIQADEEAYRAAGYSDVEAKMAATWGVALPQLAPLKNLTQNIVDLAAAYRREGDPASADAALQIAIGLGQQMDASTGTCVPLVTRLVGIAVQRMALGAMDPSTGYGDGTVQQQLDQLVQRRTSIHDLVQQVNPLMQQMTAEDWQNYNQRTLVFGEENAMGWLVNKYGQK